MRNTTLSQLPDGRRGFLYYMAAFCLLLCLCTVSALPARAEETADSSSGSTSDTTDTDGDLTLGGDITDAYDKYAGGIDSGLDDVKDQYDGLVDDSALGFVQTVTSWIPAEIWAVIGLSLASTVVLGIIRYLQS